MVTYRLARGGVNEDQVPVKDLTVTVIEAKTLYTQRGGRND